MCTGDNLYMLYMRSVGGSSALGKSVLTDMDSPTSAELRAPRNDRRVSFRESCVKSTLEFDHFDSESESKEQHLCHASRVRSVAMAAVALEAKVHCFLSC